MTPSKKKLKLFRSALAQILYVNNAQASNFPGGFTDFQNDVNGVEYSVQAKNWLPSGAASGADAGLRNSLLEPLR
ncbi:MAG: hypothetical protein Q8N35_01925 [Methylococcaceae bacterium]|uniref:hypothetical protein n=1 Tax=Methylicorpusculum sp. TaxID=2713644 RepID=UPI002727C8D2|nr:hypothetical protein [Methylicorpusculum sp.]MDO9163382.1 hypothetical protein [Methylococcaceae bacterium]MDZ4156738.1 hypothetical protein [Methylococcales bacterium]MDP2393358.1 hypothetical protein [Methylococcaceae bacterium]MDP3018321.1 hypothetical protein [Methylococcaceae bacterium]MDP3388539.1 hypothetical protein [Methylococcaceae bacterium]